MDFRIGEINIICTQIDRSLIFYRDVLGFRVLEKEDGAVRLLLDGNSLLLLPFAESPASDAAYCSRAEMSFDLLTDDLVKAVEHFSAHNVDFEKPWEPGTESVVVKDPDGLRIEVIYSQPPVPGRG